jgi:hypothetical protein
MAISPNTDFTAGQVMTAAQANAFPRGIMALATSTTNYALTTSVAVATGMTVTFTAVANRNYKVTYYEPQAQITNLSTGVTTISVRPTNAAGTALQSAFLKNVAAVSGFGSLLCTFVTTFSAGSITLVGCGVTSSTSDGPNLIGTASSVRTLLVEDIGPA